MPFQSLKREQLSISADSPAKATVRRRAIFAALAFALQGCSIGKISWVGIEDRNTPNTTIGCGIHPNIQGCQIGKPIQAMIGGVGECTLFRVHWGDGQSTDVVNTDLGNYPANAKFAFVSHTYTGWPGTKRVTVEGVTNCAGTANADFMLAHEISPTARRTDTPIVLLQPVTTTCTPVPNKPPLRPNTIVTIMADPSLPATNYGCFLGIDCIFGADGQPGSSAPTSFPFAGLRKYSMVLRVGGDLFQGGLNANFTTTHPGALEICVNDDILNDNKGGWLVNIEVDERAAR